MYKQNSNTDDIYRCYSPHNGIPTHVTSRCQTIGAAPKQERLTANTQGNTRLLFSRPRNSPIQPIFVTLQLSVINQWLVT